MTVIELAASNIKKALGASLDVSKLVTRPLHDRGVEYWTVKSRTVLGTSRTIQAPIFKSRDEAVALIEELAQ